MNFILREDDDGGKEELYEVRDVIWECYDTIMDAYEFYSVAGSSISSVYSITLNSYSDFVERCSENALRQKYSTEFRRRSNP